MRTTIRILTAGLIMIGATTAYAQTDVPAEAFPDIPASIFSLGSGGQFLGAEALGHEALGGHTYYCPCGSQGGKCKQCFAILSTLFHYCPCGSEGGACKKCRALPHGMVAPGMMAPGMMAPGMMAPGMMAPSLPATPEPLLPQLGMQVEPITRLSTNDVQAYLTRVLTSQGFDRLRVEAIEETEDTITADIVTAEGSLVQRVEVDRYTGLISRGD